MNNSVTNIIEYFNDHGGFKNFHGTLFAMLPIPDRIEILKEEFNIRPIAKTIDKLILAYAKNQDIENTHRYIDVGITMGLLDESIRNNDHYTSWLNSGPTKIITPESAYWEIKGTLERDEYDVSQINALLTYLDEQYPKLGISQGGKTQEKEITEAEKQIYKNFSEGMKQILMQDPTKGLDKSFESLDKKMEKFGSDMEAFNRNEDRVISGIIKPISFIVLFLVVLILILWR